MTLSDMKVDLAGSVNLWFHTTATILALVIYLLAAIVHKAAARLWREVVSIYQDLME